MILKNFHSMKINEINEQFEKGRLIVDDSYQRRKIWNDTDKIRLIETILIGYLIPSLYFWDATTDPKTGVTITHIVDGQQRVNAIVDFIEGKFSLKKACLTQIELSGKFANKTFMQLSEQERVMIWSYEIPIVKISNIKKIEEIKNLFYRLNLTDYNLKSQEKRHSKSNGLFAELAIELSELEFWSKYNLFNAGDLKRMKDVEFCASLILLIKRGIINQTTQKVLNDAYDDYDKEYPKRNEDKDKILLLIEELEKFIDNQTIGFIQKKSQLYTLFSVINYFKEDDKEINDDMISNFKKFVYMYIDFKESKLKKKNKIDSILKAYKLAASEGIHKLKNRKIRYEIMKEVMLKGLDKVEPIW